MTEETPEEPFPPFPEEEDKSIPDFNHPDLTNVPPPKVFGNLFHWRVENKLMHPVFHEMGMVIILRMLIFGLFLLLVGIRAGQELSYVQLQQTTLASTNAPDWIDFCNKTVP